MNLQSTLSILNGSITLADIGAADYGTKELHSALFGGAATRYCFDADPSALAKLQAANEPTTIVLPYILGDGSDQTLHLAQGGMTSLLEPVSDQFSLYTLFSKPPFWPIEQSFKRIAVSTKRLDDVREIGSIDYLKIDTQGSELTIIKNGVSKLKNVSVIHIEASFVPLYRNQPLFSDVDIEMRRLGFMVHGFASMKRLPLAPFELAGPLIGLNQLVDLDVVYVRDFAQPDQISIDQLKKTALIADQCYASFDLTTRCLTELTRRSALPQSVVNDYLVSLNNRQRLLAVHHFPAPSAQ